MVMMRRQSKIASLSMFGESRRWKAGTRCQAKYKKHFYDATIVRFNGHPENSFRVMFEKYSICANVRAADLRRRDEILKSSPLNPPSDEPASKAKRRDSYENDAAVNNRTHCWQPPGGMPKQIGGHKGRVAPRSATTTHTK